MVWLLSIQTYEQAPSALSPHLHNTMKHASAHLSFDQLVFTLFQFDFNYWLTLMTSYNFKYISSFDCLQQTTSNLESSLSFSVLDLVSLTSYYLIHYMKSSKFNFLKSLVNVFASLHYHLFLFSRRLQPSCRDGHLGFYKDHHFSKFF